MALITCVVFLTVYKINKKVKKLCWFLSLVWLNERIKSERTNYTNIKVPIGENVCFKKSLPFCIRVLQVP